MKDTFSPGQDPKWALGAGPGFPSHLLWTWGRMDCLLLSPGQAGHGVISLATMWMGEPGGSLLPASSTLQDWVEVSQDEVSGQRLTMGMPVSPHLGFL